MNRTRTLRLLAVMCLAAALAFSFFAGPLQKHGVSLGIGVSLLLVVVGWPRCIKTATDVEPSDVVSQTPSQIHAANTTTEEMAGVDISVLGTGFRKKQLEHIEHIVDDILDSCISLIRSSIDAHTIGILFPTHDNGYKLRRYYSKSEHVDDSAVIYPGVGVIGSFLKDGLKKLNLQEIVTDSMTLYYYKKDAGIRSLMATPIVADGVKRGSIIVDSTQKKHFTDEHHAFLATMADVCGQAVYYAYMYNQHKLEHARLSAMSSTEKFFFHKNDMDSILDKVAEIIPFAFTCDRLTISLADPETRTLTVRRAWGLDREQFQDMHSSLDEKTLISLIYNKNMSITRNFTPERYEVRYREDEPRRTELSSFLALPIGVKECKGLILLESLRRDAFPQSSHALLSRLVTSAGLAIERVQILEQTENLATHDGLTGLNNHRRFQQLLKEAITRSIRYKQPLSLVICDIDHFKKVNDTWGHRFGDTVLRVVSAKLQSSIRDNIDIAARYGGEEFALVLEKTDQETALDTVERIRGHIADMIFQTPQGKEIHVSMSFGIAVYGVHARNQEALIQRADKALYCAKENGRNRVELYYDSKACSQNCSGG
ncbi:MAG: diguanylate cyclase [Chitinivibrionales bacterium]